MYYCSMYARMRPCLPVHYQLHGVLFGAFLNELTETDFCMKLLYRRWRQAARGAFLNELTETDFCMKLLYSYMYLLQDTSKTNHQ